MPTPETPAILARSRRLYAALLRAYPRDFRRAHGAAMAQLFRDCSRDAHADAGRRGLLRLWWRTLGDLGVSVPREWGAALVAAFRREGGVNSQVMPAQALGSLQRIIPVVQTRRREPWSVTFVSVERWEGALIANFTLRWDAAVDDKIFRTLDPHLALRATDDGGGHYRVEHGGSSGGGGADGGHMNVTYTLTPAPHPAVRTLHFEARVQLLAQEGFPPRLVARRTEPECWPFAVAVPAVESAAP